MFFEGIFKSSAVKPSSEAAYKIFVPNAEEGVEYGLVFSHDGFNIQAAEAMQKLYERGDAPPCVFVGVRPSNLMATLDGGFDRWMRQNDYDIFDSAYPEFIVDELIPYVTEAHGLKISASPDMHLVLGGSSGGISSFNMAWFKPDYFHRVYMSSPSFLSMNNGREIPALIRKCETLPLRIWVEYSENEPDDYFGSSYAAAIDSIRALKFAGYDMDTEYFAGEGHCSRYHNTDAFEKALGFLWKNWQTEPVKAPRSSKRFEAIFPVGTAWERLENTESGSHKRVKCTVLGGDYAIDGKEIYFERNGERKAVASFEKELSAISVSSDGWRLYAASADLPCIYAHNITSDGSLSGRYIHAALHRNTDFVFAGAFDICVGAHDRVYAATELGVQCVRPFGLVDAISPLPRREIPQKIKISTVGDNKKLVAFVNGGAYARTIREADGDVPDTAPFPKEYYD